MAKKYFPPIRSIFLAFFQCFFGVFLQEEIDLFVGIFRGEAEVKQSEGTPTRRIRKNPGAAGVDGYLEADGLCGAA